MIFHKFSQKVLVENIDKPHSHTSSFQIISAIHEILTNDSSEDLLFYGRVNNEICAQVVQKCTKDLPNFENLQKFTSEKKKELFLNILDIDLVFSENCLNVFPNSWHLLVITLKYMCQVTFIDWPFIYSLVLSKIVLSYIDKKLERIRSVQSFDIFASKFTYQPDRVFHLKEFFHVSEAIEEIDINDSFKALEHLHPSFEITQDLRNNETALDRNVIHTMSEFQSCFFHINLLNDLFDMPYETCLISDCFNGTFIYNIINKIQRENRDFIQNSLHMSPRILSCFNFIISLLINQMEGI